MIQPAASSPPGTPRLHLRRIDSTNARARALALAGAPHGTLVTAAEQTSGRGRQGRTWSAPAGSSLLMSLLLRPPPRLTPLIAAVAVSDAVERRGVRPLIKWPNDIVLEAPSGLAKLSGILVEGRPQEGWAVLGIGINVAVELDQLPPELRSQSASLLGLPSDIEPLLRDLLADLRRRLEQPPRDLLAAWSERDALRGRQIAWGPAGGERAEHRGLAEGIDGEGRLVVELDGGGRTTLEAGEVHLARQS